MTALRNVEAFGPRRAVCQRVLERLAAGHSVASTCQEPYGLFIARTAAELEPYCTQLESRCKGLYKRRRLVRNVQRSLRAAEAGTRKPPTDETGQLLFVEASRTQPR